jgi:toxin ParE1/3/4
MRLSRTATYRADLERIVDYIASDNAKAALAIWVEIEAQVEKLVAFPYSGRLGRVEGTRELVVNRTPFVVGYRVTRDAVLVLRVLHGAQQWPDELRE